MKTPCFRWDPFHRLRYWDLYDPLCDLLASSGDSSIGRFHTDLSSEYQNAHIYWWPSGDGLKGRGVLRQVEHYSITVNQIMVATVKLSKWWCDLYYIPATQESLIPHILRTYLISISHQHRYFLFLESLICIAVVVITSHSGDGLN